MLPLDNRSTVQLRALDSTDEALYCGLYGDTETMRFVTTPLTKVQAQRSFYGALRSTPEQYWFVMALDGTAVGLCGVSAFNASGTQAEVGLMLCPHAHGRGIATAGLHALVDWAFATLAVEALTANSASENRAAHRVTERVGFRGHIDSADNGYVATLDRQRWRADPSIKKGQT